MNTYGERLESAMQEAGFGGPGGQTRLAKEIGARSQTINQALKGGSKELSATFHVRAAMRLGVRPLWLSEGRGPRHEPGGPKPAVLGAGEVRPFTPHADSRIPVGSQYPTAARTTSPLLMEAVEGESYQGAEARLVTLLRDLPTPMRDAIERLIYAASDSLKPPL